MTINPRGLNLEHTVKRTIIKLVKVFLGAQN